MGNRVSLTSGYDTGSRLKICRSIGQGHNIIPVIGLSSVSYSQFSKGKASIQCAYASIELPVKNSVAEPLLAENAVFKPAENLTVEKHGRTAHDIIGDFFNIRDQIGPGWPDFSKGKLRPCMGPFNNPLQLFEPGN